MPKQLITVQGKLGKTRFFADENIDSAIVDYLRDKGYKVEFAAELGFKGKHDSFHLQEATRRKCALLTSDSDFLDNKRFPFHSIKKTTVIVLKTNSSSTSNPSLGFAMMALEESVAKSGNKNLLGLKIEISGLRVVLHAEIAGRNRRDVIDVSKPSNTRLLFE